MTYSPQFLQGFFYTVHLMDGVSTVMSIGLLMGQTKSKTTSQRFHSSPQATAAYTVLGTAVACGVSWYRNEARPMCRGGRFVNSGAYCVRVCREP